MPNDPLTGKKHSFSDLETLSREADTMDKHVFAEMRTNLLLVSGDHYTNTSHRILKQLRAQHRTSNNDQKLRLTKNHVQRICNRYCNTLLSTNPGVGFSAKNPSENQDQKAAELNKAVWQDAVTRYSLHKLRDLWCSDFVDVGEVAVKIFWDPDAGDLKGFEQKLDKRGKPVFESVSIPGQRKKAQIPVPDRDLPVFQGEMIFERLWGFNLKRAPEAQTMDDSPYLIADKMTSKDELLKKWKDTDKERLIVDSGGKTFMVFDHSQGAYRKTENEILIKEYYFRPGPIYPKGWFFFTTGSGILEEGELPGGIFPIVMQQFKSMQTSPRGQSIIKTLRPYQIEINRAASKIAEHQITLGDDKLLVQNGTKISAGGQLPGVRAVNYTGMPPSILAGRDGSQYLNYMQSQTEEMYQVVDLELNELDSKESNQDSFALLFSAASKKKRFQTYISRFENFMVDVATTYLGLAKVHFTDDRVIKMIGRDEIVNITEFKNTEDIHFQIIIEPQADDIETKMGKQLILNNA